MAYENAPTEYETLKQRMLPSCTVEEKTILAGLEAEGLAGTKTDAQILSALADIMVSQLERSRMAITMDPATAALTTLAQSLTGIKRQQHIEILYWKQRLTTWSNG